MYHSKSRQYIFFLDASNISQKNVFTTKHLKTIYIIIFLCIDYSVTILNAHFGLNTCVKLFICVEADGGGGGSSGWIPKTKPILLQSKDQYPVECGMWTIIYLKIWSLRVVKNSKNHNSNKCITKESKGVSICVQYLYLILYTFSWILNI